MRRAKTLLERIDARRDKSGGPSACWPRTSGGDTITIGPGKTATEIRRAVWFLAYGEMPPRYRPVALTCDTKHCLNPAHMARLTEVQRFWLRVDRRGPNECWPWRGYKIRGYGRFQLADRHRRYFAHRYAYECVNGGIVRPQSNAENVVMHTCDNPSCCNPKHLRKGTALDNTRDMIAKGRAAFQKDPSGFRAKVRASHPKRRTGQVRGKEQP